MNVCSGIRGESVGVWGQEKHVDLEAYRIVGLSDTLKHTHTTSLSEAVNLI